MLITDVKKHIAYKTSQAKKMPDDEVLASLINEALYYIATNTTPQVLLRDELYEQEIPLRLLENGKSIIVPIYPTITEDDHIQIDEELTYAVIYYVSYLISGNPDYYTQANNIIAVYSTNYSEEAYG